MNTRDLGISGSGAGKGDSDRSPGWRQHYDEIRWEHGVIDDPAFKRRGNKLVKRYGPAAPIKLEDDFMMTL